MAILLRYLIAAFILWNKLSQRWYVMTICKETDFSFNITCIYAIYQKQGTNSLFGPLDFLDEDEVWNKERSKKKLQSVPKKRTNKTKMAKHGRLVNISKWSKGVQKGLKW